MTLAKAISKVRKLRLCSLDALVGLRPIEAEVYWAKMLKIREHHGITDADIRRHEQRERAREQWAGFVGTKSAE